MKIREQVKLLHTLINKYKKPQNKNQTKRYKNDNIPSPRNGFIGTYNHLNMFMSEKHIIHLKLRGKDLLKCTRNLVHSSISVKHDGVCEAN